MLQSDIDGDRCKRKAIRRDALNSAFSKRSLKSFLEFFKVRSDQLYPNAAFQVISARRKERSCEIIEIQRSNASLDYYKSLTDSKTSFSLRVI